MWAEFNGKNVRLSGSALSVRKRGTWYRVEPRQLDLNAVFPHRVEVVDLGRFDCDDVGLHVREISRRVGVIRIDEEVAGQIWASPSAVRGDKIAIAFDLGELVWSPYPRSHPSEIVHPFRSFKEVRTIPKASLAERWTMFQDDPGVPLAGLSITLVELADRMGLPLL